MVAPVDLLYSLEILKDWIDLIDDDGWVAREQILGEEARSKVQHRISPRLLDITDYPRPSGSCAVSDTGSQLCQPPYVGHGCDGLYKTPRA